MEILWTTYGVPMEQHASNTGAIRKQHARNTGDSREQGSVGHTTDFFGVGGRLSLTPRFSEVGVAREPAPQPLQRFTVVGKPLKRFRRRDHLSLRSPQHILHPKLPRLLPLPFRRGERGEGWGEGLLRVVYPAVLAVKSPRAESSLAPGPVAARRTRLRWRIGHDSIAEQAL